MYQFHEDDLEELTLEWLEELGYETLHGPDIAVDGEYPERNSYQDVILGDRLEEALWKINPQASSNIVNRALRSIEAINSPSVVINNRNFQKYVTDGIDVEYRTDDGRNATQKLWLFDWENINNNEFVAVNQFTVIEGQYNKRPDIVIFVNGLPLVVIELKNATDERTGITEAFRQIQTYKSTVPSLFNYNTLLIVSDGINARVGSLTANEERFMMWRTVDGETIEPTSKPQLETLIRGVLKKEVLLDLLRHFVVFQSDGDHTYKIVAAYHQYYAVNKAVDEAIRASGKDGDRKIGVIWHTQGSGKSLTMVFFTGKLVLAMNNPTFVVLTDRNDLDDQLYGTFSMSKDLLRQTQIG